MFVAGFFPAHPRRFESGVGTFDCEVAFHLREGGDHGEQRFAEWGVCVDGFGEELEFDFLFMQFIEQFDEVNDRAAEAVDFPDDKGVAWSYEVQTFFQTIAFCGGSGGVIGEYLFAPRVFERVKLQVERLIFCRSSVRRGERESFFPVYIGKKNLLYM